jgi:glycosyltransferase involved in cell wall biosynthesis
VSGAVVDWAPPVAATSPPRERDADGRVRVLFVVNNFVAGGAERHLLELWSRLDRSRFAVEIACFRAHGQFEEAVRALGWPVHDLGIGDRIYAPSGIRGFVRLVHLVLGMRPHVIHGYLFGPNLFAALAGRLARVPVVVVAKRNVDAFESRRQIGVQRLAHRLATHVVAVSERVADSSVALGVPRARVTVIPNGVDVERFAADGNRAPDLGLRPGVPVIGSVGCLAPRKDQRMLLDALARLASEGRDFEVLLIGDGSERAALETHARGLGLEPRVHFLGERPDVERLLPRMDVFVLSSREEGIPNALLEAMAAGRPAVATAVGGTPEVLEDGRTGWLVPSGDAAALAAVLTRVLADPAEAVRRAQAARADILERRSIDAMVRRHERFYRDALSGVTAEVPA